MCLPQRHLVRLISDSCSSLSSYSSLDEELTFIHPDDAELYNTLSDVSFELQVANHELLGHGSGKLFQESADGQKNFNPDKVCHYPGTYLPKDIS